MQHVPQMNNSEFKKTGIAVAPAQETMETQQPVLLKLKSEENTLKKVLKWVDGSGIHPSLHLIYLG